MLSCTALVVRSVFFHSARHNLTDEIMHKQSHDAKTKEQCDCYGSLPAIYMLLAARRCLERASSRSPALACFLFNWFRSVSSQDSYMIAKMTGARQQQSLGLDLDDALLTVVSSPNFLLYPKVTLSVDACELGQCGICHESQLLLRDHGAIIDDQTVAILPCGHIAVRQLFSYPDPSPFPSLLRKPH